MLFSGDVSFSVLPETGRQAASDSISTPTLLVSAIGVPLFALLAILACTHQVKKKGRHGKQSKLYGTTDLHPAVKQRPLKLSEVLDVSQNKKRRPYPTLRRRSTLSTFEARPVLPPDIHPYECGRKITVLGKGHFSVVYKIRFQDRDAAMKLSNKGRLFLTTGWANMCCVLGTDVDKLF